MQNQVGTPATATTAPGTVSLDESILRFWNDFVSKQIEAGRRDVGRMLEVALEFYFDRSTQASQGEIRRRQALDSFERQVRHEIAKVEQLLATLKGDADGEMPPYRGLQITVRTDGAETPVEAKPYPQPFSNVQEVHTYHGMLTKQAGAAQQVLQLITDKLVRQRRATAQRLKDLSPLLYQQGVDRVAAAETLRAEEETSALPEPSHDETAQQPSVWTLVKRVVATMHTARTPPTETSTDDMDPEAKLRVYQDLAAKWLKER